MNYELKTPTDKRTIARKLLEKKVRDIKIPCMLHKYGAWTYLSIRDMEEFTNQFLYNVN